MCDVAYAQAIEESGEGHGVPEELLGEAHGHMLVDLKALPHCHHVAHMARASHVITFHTGLVPAAGHRLLREVDRR